jgi:hypothetical protein
MNIAHPMPKIMAQTSAKNRISVALFMATSFLIAFHEMLFLYKKAAHPSGF